MSVRLSSAEKDFNDLNAQPRSLVEMDIVSCHRTGEELVAVWMMWSCGGCTAIREC